MISTPSHPKRLPLLAPITGVGGVPLVTIAAAALAIGVLVYVSDRDTARALLRFGYWRISFGVAGDSIAHGIDNWKVTVWRR